MTNFAYLQIHTRHSYFGGLDDPEEIYTTLHELVANNPGSYAAALTDTFSLAGLENWLRLCAQSADSIIKPIIGVEVAIELEGFFYSLLLYASSRQGYVNLQRLLSESLLIAGEHPFNSSVSLPQLAKHSRGLIAISPYSGGAVAASLMTDKRAETRARELKEVFAPDSFYLGVPAVAEIIAARAHPDLAKNWRKYADLAQKLRIGLVATGETRYAHSTDADRYQSQRSRALTNLAQKPQYRKLINLGAKTAKNRPPDDYLFALRADKSRSLHLLGLAELSDFYIMNEFKGALTNNQQIAERCTGWLEQTADPWLELRQYCYERLEATGLVEPLLPRLEQELATIAELELAQPLLALASLLRNAPPERVIIVRRLYHSLVARLLGFNTQSLENFINAEPEGIFEAYSYLQPLRVEVGATTPPILLTKLAHQMLPLAMPAEPDRLPLLHPRLVVYSPATLLADSATLTPATGNQISGLGVQEGAYNGAECARFELAVASGIDLLQRIVDTLNAWYGLYRQTGSTDNISAAGLPFITGVMEAPDERQAVLQQLEALRQLYSAAYFAAAMSQGQNNRALLTKLATEVRQAGIRLLPPRLNYSQPHFTLENDPPTIRTGLELILGSLASAFTREQPVNSLDELLRRAPLSATQIEQLAWSGALSDFGKPEQLAAAAGQLSERSYIWQSWQNSQPGSPATLVAVPPPAEMQLGLFALLDEPAATNAANLIAEPEPLVLPEVAAVSRLELLQQAQRALGFITADFALWQLPTDDTSPNRIVSLSDIARLDSKLPFYVAGMVVAVRRVMTDEAAKAEITVAWLTDLNGQAEILLPASIAANGVEIKAGESLIALVQQVEASEGGAALLVALAISPPGKVPVAPADPLANEVINSSIAEATASYNGDYGDEAPPPDAPPLPDADFDLPLARPSANAGHGNKPDFKTGNAEPNRKRPTKGQFAASILPRKKRLVITFPADPGEQMLEGVRGILEMHSGDEPIMLIIPKAGGEPSKLEPQSLSVNLTSDLTTALENLLGAGSVQLEESSY